MTKLRSPESPFVAMFAGGCARGVLSASVAIACLIVQAGCASIHRGFPAIGATWDPGVEVRFPAAATGPEEAAQEDAPIQEAGSESRVVAAPDVPMPPVHRLVRKLAAVGLFAYDQLGFNGVPRKLRGIPDYEDTKYTLLPGTYAFEYESPSFRPVYGAVSLYPVLTPRARDFIRHASIALTPSPAGARSVLSEADLNRARNGDVVTKVVFIADHRAVRDRLDDINRGLREFARLRSSLDEQKSYWDRKLAERRLNSRYSSDFGWGVDVPGWDLALLQSVVGPERYHWHRFSVAEDKVRTYEEKLARLDLPERRLREERDALKQLLHSVDVIHRSNDMLILAPSMIRPYRDPVHEVHTLRGSEVWADNYPGKIPFEANDWVGPWGAVHFPYWYSSLSMAGLLPGLRPVPAPSMAMSKNIGEVLLVVQVGARRPIELGGHSWVSNP